MTEASKGAEPAVMAPATIQRSFDLRPLFAPRSIAIVGASPRGDLATTIRDNIPRVGSETRCFFVNPRYDEVDGSPCFPDLASLPEVPDIVVVAVNPLRAPSIVRDAAAAGVPAVVIPGGGVVEGGEPAARMQAEVAEIAIETGTAVLGPNCMGLIDLSVPSATYIDDLPTTLRRGGMAAIAQSGSVTDAFVHAGTRIGWSRIISCGSEIVLDVCDYLGACLDDPETTAVALFVEGFKRPERFLALADRAFAIDKPILVVKVGRSDQARAAAVAHTGSLAGDTRASDAALRAAGVIRCDDLDELIEAVALVDRSRRLGRRIGAGRTGVVTVSTGEGSLIADLAPRVGLDLPPIPPRTGQRLATALPTLGYIGNPLDPWGAGEGRPTYRACFDAFVESGAYDIVALVHDFPFRSQPGEVELAVDLATELVSSTAAHPGVLPAFISLTSGDVTPEVEALLDEAGGVPALRGTVPAFAAIARLASWERRRADRLVRGPVRATWPRLAERVPSFGFDPAAREALGRMGAGTAGPESGPTVAPDSPAWRARSLAERESLELLRAAGLPMNDSVAIEGSDPAVMLAAATEAATRLGWPVAVKVDAPGLSHKTEAGGVALNVRDPDELRRALAAVLAAPGSGGSRGSRSGLSVRGVLIQPMAPAGLELIAGARRDPQFGPLVLVGLGGILAEVLDDVAVRLAPIHPDEALTMLGELRGAALLRGLRGRPAVDRGAVARVVVSLGAAIEANPGWLEIDLNPLIAGPGGALAVDALIVVAGGADA